MRMFVPPAWLGGYCGPFARTLASFIFSSQSQTPKKTPLPGAGCALYLGFGGEFLEEPCEVAVNGLLKRWGFDDASRVAEGIRLPRRWAVGFRPSRSFPGSKPKWQDRAGGHRGPPLGDCEE